VTEDRAAAGAPADIARQLREAADRLMAGWTSTPGSIAGAAPVARPPLPRLPALPATMSADQVQRVLDDLAARRGQVQALRDQLTEFDEQLGMLESSLRPVVEWTRTWADLEKSVSAFWRSGGAGPS